MQVITIKSITLALFKNITLYKKQAEHKAKNHSIKQKITVVKISYMITIIKHCKRKQVENIL